MFDVLFKLCFRLKTDLKAVGEALRTRSSWPPLDEGGVPGSEYHLPLEASPYGRNYRAGKCVGPGKGVECDAALVSVGREAANDPLWVDTVQESR